MSKISGDKFGEAGSAPSGWVKRILLGGSELKPTLTVVGGVLKAPVAPFTVLPLRSV